MRAWTSFEGAGVDSLTGVWALVVRAQRQRVNMAFMGIDRQKHVDDEWSELEGWSWKSKGLDGGRC